MLSTRSNTIWSGWLNEDYIRQRVHPHHIEENLIIGEEKIITPLTNNPLGPASVEVRTVIRDRNAIPGSRRIKCVIATDLSDIIRDLRANNVLIAIASKNHNKFLTDRALWLINMIDPRRNNAQRPLIDLVKYNEVQDASKQIHMQRIKHWSQIKFKDMILFDDNPVNFDVEQVQGVFFRQVSNGREGITWQDYQKGLDRWRRFERIREPYDDSMLTSDHGMELVGYVGTDEATAKLYERGKRRPISQRPSRWGWGTYVTDDPEVAMLWAKWDRDPRSPDIRVCAVYARNKEKWLSLKKVWLPEEHVFTKVWGNEQDQGTWGRTLALDGHIRQVFGFSGPYVPFCMHHWMPEWKGLIPKGKRSNEMVLYPNLWEALMMARPVTLYEARENMRRGYWPHLDWRSRMHEWNIAAIRETWDDFADEDRKWPRH